MKKVRFLVRLFFYPQNQTYILNGGHYLYTHLEDYIHNLYKSIGVTNPAELNMFRIAKNIGVEIIYKKRAFRFNNEIVLNRGTESEEWMTFGHELCHYLRHCGCQLNMNPLFIQLQEWQANNFMYHFCAPTFMLRELNLPHNYRKAIWIIQRSFNVSYEFAEVRLKQFVKSRSYAMV